LLQAHGDLAEFQRLNITYINQSVISGLLARMYLLKKIGLMLLNMHVKRAHPMVHRLIKQN
jgi:hypothetical protein